MQVYMGFKKWRPVKVPEIQRLEFNVQSLV